MPRRATTASPSLAALTLVTAAGLVSVLTGCAAHSNPVAVLNAPAAYQPVRAREVKGLPPGQRPDPVDLSDPRAFVRTRVEATIIDTRSFANPRQITAPFTGTIRMIENEIEEHKDHDRDGEREREDKDRDAAREREEREGLGELPRARVDHPAPIGQAVEMDRVHQRGATGFVGIAQTEWSPPDPTLAVGPNHIVETVNAAIAFYNKHTGELEFSTHLGSPGSPGFFEPVGANTNFVFDPKCFFDQKVGRFVVIGLEQNGNDSWIDIAVSDDDNPSGVWYKYRTNSTIAIGSSTYWVDYPGFGFDDHAWYVTGNLFKLTGPGGDFGGPLFRIFDKTPMLTGQPVTMTDFAPQDGGSLQAAQMFGDAPSCYFLSRVNTAGLKIWTITNPTTSPSLESVVIQTNAQATGPSQDAPNQGGGSISTLDGRLMNVHCRDGKLYTAHAINGAPGITVARWYQIDLNGWPDTGGAPATVQVGEVTGPGGRHYYFPAIYSDKFDNVAMVTASSSPSTYASVRVSGRNPSDPIGTMSEPIELAIGDRTADGRWGDYLDIAMDPTNDTTFWVVGIYRKSFGWQTWIDHFSIDPGCPADLTNDGQLNFFDIASFLADFNAQLPTADINDDGRWNFFDVSAYITLYNQGCP